MVSLDTEVLTTEMVCEITVSNFGYNNSLIFPQ